MRQLRCCKYDRVLEAFGVLFYGDFEYALGYRRLPDWHLEGATLDLRHSVKSPPADPPEKDDSRLALHCHAHS